MKCENAKCDVPRYNRLIPPYAYWTDFTPVIPSLYWDVYSAEQRYHAICKELGKVICYCDMLGENVNLNAEHIAELVEEFNKFKESGFYDYYAEQIEQWINDNLPWLFRTFAKQVYFGLTLDGHFVAYIPDSWDDIVFDTGMVYGLDTYGRLMLRWDVDDSGEAVNQRPEDWS